MLLAHNALKSESNGLALEVLAIWSVILWDGYTHVVFLFRLEEKCCSRTIYCALQRRDVK